MVPGLGLPYNSSVEWGAIGGGFVTKKQIIIYNGYQDSKTEVWDYW